MSHQSSPFLSLPREIRDEICRYVVIEHGGFHHNPVTGRLRTLQSTPTHLAMSKTCKQMASEMVGVALRENSITFKPYSDANVHAQGLLFRRASVQWYWAIKQMLGWAAECVTQDHLITLQSLYPHIGGIPLLRAMDQSERIRTLESVGIPGPMTDEGFSRALAKEDLLLMISTDKRFHDLTAKEYDEELRGGQKLFEEYSFDNDPPHTPVYVPDSQQRLLELRFEDWDIPDSARLEEIIRLAPRPCWWYENKDPDQPEPIVYYSASAYAIQFFRSLPLECRQNIRRVVIEEGESCVGKVQSNANGLIPFCQENPKLRVEIKVNAVQEFLIGPWRSWTGYFPITGLIGRLVTWLYEISLLADRRMPQGQCSYTFDGAEPSLLLRLWDGIKRCAAINEAIDRLPEAPPGEGKHPLLHHLLHPYTHILIKQVINGELPVSFGPDLGEVWDIEQACYDLEHTIPSSDDWRNVVDLAYLEEREDIMTQIQTS